jgi:hypothetical protein
MVVGSVWAACRRLGVRCVCGGGAVALTLGTM